MEAALHSEKHFTHFITIETDLIFIIGISSVKLGVAFYLFLSDFICPKNVKSNDEIEAK